MGLAWRPEGESICCEIYSTGRANLPGSTRERDLLYSFSRMAPELLRHSDRPDMLDLVPEELKDAHRPKQVDRDDAPAGRALTTGGRGGSRGKKRRASAAAVTGGGMLDDAAGGTIANLWDDGGDELPPLQATGAGAAMTSIFEGDDDEAEALLDGAGF